MDSRVPVFSRPPIYAPKPTWRWFRLQEQLQFGTPHTALAVPVGESDAQLIYDYHGQHWGMIGELLLCRSIRELGIEVPGVTASWEVMSSGAPCYAGTPTSDVTRGAIVTVNIYSSSSLIGTVEAVERAGLAVGERLVNSVIVMPRFSWDQNVAADWVIIGGIRGL